MEDDILERFLQQIRERGEVGRRPLLMGDLLEHPDAHYRMGDGIDDELERPAHLPGRFVIDEEALHNELLHGRGFSIDAMSDLHIQPKIHPPKPSITAKVKVKTVNGKMVKE